MLGINIKRLLRWAVDADLLQYTEIWAAAGTPNALFEIDPAELIRLCGGIALRVKA